MIRSLLSETCSCGTLRLVACFSLKPIPGLMTWTSTLSQSLLDKTFRNTACLKQSFLTCSLSRLRYELVEEVSEMVPMTPPELWGRWPNGVLVSPLPSTPPLSPRTPEGPPPPTPPEAFFPGTPPGALPVTPPDAFRRPQTPRGMLGGAWWPCAAHVTKKRADELCVLWQLATHNSQLKPCGFLAQFLVRWEKVCRLQLT